MIARCISPHDTATTIRDERSYAFSVATRCGCPKQSRALQESSSRADDALTVYDASSIQAAVMQVACTTAAYHPYVVATEPSVLRGITRSCVGVICVRCVVAQVVVAGLITGLVIPRAVITGGLATSVLPGG